MLKKEKKDKEFTIGNIAVIIFTIIAIIYRNSCAYKS